jgi:hypothetical protein
MYIRRIKGPHSVTLPDGTVLSRADLPEPDTRRWVASRKAAVVLAVDHGLLSAAEACGIWSLSEEELGAWRSAASRHGVAALKATAVQRYRGPHEGGETNSTSMDAAKNRYTSDGKSKLTISRDDGPCPSRESET